MILNWVWAQWYSGKEEAVEPPDVTNPFLSCYYLLSNSPSSLTFLAFQSCSSEEKYNTKKANQKQQDQPQSPQRASSEIRFTFDVFICVAVIMLKRQEFFACQDAAEVFSVACNIGGSINLEEVHHKAYKLFYRYWKKHVKDSSTLKNNVLNSFSKVFKWKWK